MIYEEKAKDALDFSDAKIEVYEAVQKEIKKWIDDIQNDEEPYQNDVEILKKLHGGIKK